MDRIYIIGFRVSDQERQDIKEFCEEQGYDTLSECIREIMLLLAYQKSINTKKRVCL